MESTCRAGANNSSVRGEKRGSGRCCCGGGKEENSEKQGRRERQEAKGKARTGHHGALEHRYLRLPGAISRADLTLFLVYPRLSKAWATASCMRVRSSFCVAFLPCYPEFTLNFYESGRLVQPSGPRLPACVVGADLPLDFLLPAI